MSRWQTCTHTTYNGKTMSQSETGFCLLASSTRRRDWSPDSVHQLFSEFRTSTTSCSQCNWWSSGVVLQSNHSPVFSNFQTSARVKRSVSQTSSEFHASPTQQVLILGHQMNRCILQTISSKLSTTRIQLNSVNSCSLRECIWTNIKFECRRLIWGMS